jgi:hypothetical protein
MSFANSYSKPFGRNIVAPGNSEHGAVFTLPSGKRFVAPTRALASDLKTLAGSDLVHESAVSNTALSLLEGAGVEIVRGQGRVGIEGSIQHVGDLA